MLTMKPILEKKQSSQQTKIYKIIQEYSEHSTIQGLLYIFQTNQSQVGRIFWSLVIFAVIFLGAYWSVEAYSNWKANPVLTTVKTSALPIKNIEFPAVTICSQGSNMDISSAGPIPNFVST